MNTIFSLLRPVTQIVFGFNIRKYTILWEIISQHTLIAREVTLWLVQTEQCRGNISCLTLAVHSLCMETWWRLHYHIMMGVTYISISWTNKVQWVFPDRDNFRCICNGIVFIENKVSSGDMANNDQSLFPIKNKMWSSLQIFNCPYLTWNIFHWTESEIYILETGIRWP